MERQGDEAVVAFSLPFGKRKHRGTGLMGRPVYTYKNQEWWVLIFDAHEILRWARAVKDRE